MAREPHKTEEIDARTGIKRDLVHEISSARTGSNIVACRLRNSQSPKQSQFAPIIEVGLFDVPAFSWRGLPGSRPAPAIERVVERPVTRAIPENEHPNEAVNRDEPTTDANEATAAGDPETAAIISKYFTTSSTNDSIIAGPALDIKGGELIQLRLTMTTAQVVAAIEAKQGAGSVKINTLHRSWPKAFEVLAAEKGVTVQELKGLFNKVSDVSRARNVGWKWDDESKAKKAANWNSRQKKVSFQLPEDEEDEEYEVVEVEEGGGRKKRKRKA